MNIDYIISLHSYPLIIYTTPPSVSADYSWLQNPINLCTNRRTHPQWHAMQVSRLVGWVCHSHVNYKSKAEWGFGNANKVPNLSLFISCTRKTCNWWDTGLDCGSHCQRLIRVIWWRYETLTWLRVKVKRRIFSCTARETNCWRCESSSVLRMVEVKQLQSTTLNYNYQVVGTIER